MTRKPRTQEEFDDLVDKWHDDKDASLPIHEYMGLSWDEYGLWVVNPLAMERINQAFENQRLRPFSVAEAAVPGGSKPGTRDIRPWLARRRREEEGCI